MTYNFHIQFFSGFVGTWGSFSNPTNFDRRLLQIISDAGETLSTFSEPQLQFSPPWRMNKLATSDFLKSTGGTLILGVGGSLEEYDSFDLQVHRVSFR